jgi:hypothetical protein
MPEKLPPECLVTGRDQIGKVGDIVSESPSNFISVHPGDFVGIRTRPWAGNFSDSKGAKRGVIVGLLVAAASGFLYLASLYFTPVLMGKSFVRPCANTPASWRRGGAKLWIACGNLSRR